MKQRKLARKVRKETEVPGLENDVSGNLDPRDKSGRVLYPSEKFYLPLLIDLYLMQYAFHDTGAVVTCVGENTLNRALPKWRNYPEVEPIRLVSHMNHELEIIGARLMPIRIPKTDVEVLHPVHIEKGDSEFVIGRDLMIRCQIGLEWSAEGTLNTTIPSAKEADRGWLIEIFKPPIDNPEAYNIDEVALLGKDEQAVRVEGRGQIDENLAFCIQTATNKPMKGCVVALDTLVRPKQIDENRWRAEVFVKNVTNHLIHLKPFVIKFMVAEKCNPRDIVSLEDVWTENEKGKTFERYMEQIGGEVELQPILDVKEPPRPDISTGGAKLTEEEIDKAEEDEDGLGVDLSLIHI